jgi:hypothetical protein
MTVVVNYELKKFLKKMFEFYPVDSDQADNVDNLLQEYYVTIQSHIDKKGFEYDYEHLWELIKTEYKYKTTPILPFILERLDKSEKSKTTFRSNDNGKECVFILTKINKDTGEVTRTFQQYTMWDGFSSGKGKVESHNEKYARLKKEFDKVEVRIFPDGTSIMGPEGTVFRPDREEVEILLPEYAKK